MDSVQTMRVNHTSLVNSKRLNTCKVLSCWVFLCDFLQICWAQVHKDLNCSHIWNEYLNSDVVIFLLGKECGGVFTDSKHVFKSPGYPNEYENDQICYWHIRVKYGQRIHLQFLEFDVEDDTACMADFLEIYDSYDDVNGFVGR